MTHLLPHMADRGAIWGYGASTKGAVLLQYLAMGELLAGIADKNPRKLGKIMPGVNVPIRSEKEMRKAKPAYALVLPWAFRKEFIERERALRQNGTAMVFPLPNIEVVV
jgi:NDP-4-keto-2,6-dideoxyhexose 3-C-methyltransferase